jgi:DNA-binding IclR family transcriptional regulator
VTAAVPAVARAGRILEELSKAPRKSFSAAEVAGAVGIHRATCFSILTCLAELGFVHRDPVRKTFRLGPELVHLGLASLAQHPGIAEAEREAYALARDLDAGCIVVLAVGPEMVVAVRAGEEVPELGLPPLDDTRVALAPPLGGIFVAWSAAPEIEAWLARAPEATTPEELESYRRSLAAIRARGYSIGSEFEVEVQLEEILARIGSQEATERLVVALQLADLVRHNRPGPVGTRGISHLIAPVFDVDGEVRMTLTLFGRPGQIDEVNEARYAQPLMAAASRVTRAAGGRWPDAPRSMAAY